MNTNNDGSPAHKAHTHLWLVGALGLGGGAAVLAGAPRLALLAQSLFLMVALHGLGALLMLGSGAFLLSTRRRPRMAKGLDYGWTPGWMNGLGVAALLALAATLTLAVALPRAWPASDATLLLAASFTAGNFIIRSFRRTDFFPLPMVRLLQGDHDHVLDAGCGAGRSSVALADVLGRGRITAVDRFDASYIEDGGRALLDHNLGAAGLADRVEAVRADLKALPFGEATFDSAVSTAVFDHLGASKQAAMDEVFRVLKPGARFLVGIWVPSWTSFMVGNLLALFLDSKSVWLRRAEKAGFTLRAQGVSNYAWFMLLEKPGEA